MRAKLSTLIFVVGLAACGGKRETLKDPSEAPSAAPTDDVPKWEGASPPDTAAPKSSGGASVNEAPNHREDQYDKEATEVVLKRAARQVKANCGAAKDDDGKANGPWGKATVQVQLGHNGHSKGVTVPAPFQGKPTGNCVEKAFANLTFPPWSGEDSVLGWEVEIVNPAAAPASSGAPKKP